MTPCGLSSSRSVACSSRVSSISGLFISAPARLPPCSDWPFSCRKMLGTLRTRLLGLKAIISPVDWPFTSLTPCPLSVTTI